MAKLKKKKEPKKGIIKKAVEKITKPKRIETTNQEEFAKLLEQGYKTVEIRSEIKGSDIALGIPKTYVVEK